MSRWRPLHVSKSRNDKTFEESTGQVTATKPEDGHVAVSQKLISLWPRRFTFARSSDPTKVSTAYRIPEATSKTEPRSGIVQQDCRL